jgi:integrase
LRAATATAAKAATAAATAATAAAAKVSQQQQPPDNDNHHHSFPQASKVKRSKKNIIALYPEVEEFLMSCKSLRTKDTYKSHIGRFFRFANIEPAEFLKLPAKAIQEHVLQYAIYLKKEAKLEIDHANWKTGHFSVNSVAFLLNAVKVFLEYHDITIPWKKIRRFIPEKIKVHYHVYSKEEIQKLLQVADFRERAIILILESSGMRASGLLGLLVKDFEVLKEDDNNSNYTNIGKLTVYARSDSYYHTFCTPECTAAIQFYLKWREEQGEIIKPTSPLIRDSIRKGLDGRGGVNTNMPRPLSRSRLWKIMSLLISKANLKQKGGGGEGGGLLPNIIQPDHSFRKFMNTAIANAKANPLFKEIMMGHSVKLDNVYYDRDNPESIKALLGEYLKAVDLLTINEEYRLKQENQQIKHRNKELEEGRDEVQRLRAELEPLLALKDTLIKEGLLKES